MSSEQNACCAIKAFVVDVENACKTPSSSSEEETALQSLFHTAQSLDESACQRFGALANTISESEAYKQCSCPTYDVKLIQPTGTLVSLVACNGEHKEHVPIASMTPTYAKPQ